MSLVEVYWNLRRRCYSVRERGVVIDHASSGCLRDVTFKVQPAGRDRVRRTGHKNVHAYLKGTITYDHQPAFRRVSYNPRYDDHFRLEDGQFIFEAPYVVLSPNGRIYIP